MLGRLLAEPRAAPVLAALSAAVLIAGLGCAPEALLRRALRFRSLATVELLALIFGYGAVAIALALMGLGVWALVWGILARHAVFTAAATAASGGWPMRVRPGLREAGELLRTGAAFASGSQLNLLGGQVAQLVIGRWLGAAALGHYTRAQRVASLRGAPGAVLGERWGRLARCHCPALWAGAWVVPALGLSAALARKAELPVAAALGAEILVCGAAASLAVWYAPGFARPAFPDWALANLPFDAVGRPGRWLEPALAGTCAAARPVRESR